MGGVGRIWWGMWGDKEAEEDEYEDQDMALLL